jgi:hypothetical protein
MGASPKRIPRFQNSVRVEQGSAITVLSDQTQLPVTINNDLRHPWSSRLKFDPPPESSQSSNPSPELRSSRSRPLGCFIPVQSLANGTVAVEFTLFSARQPVGEVVTIPVTIRAGWEGVISITLAALVGGVFTFGLIRAIQRRRSLVEGADE